MKTDIEIMRDYNPEKIISVGAKVGLSPDDLITYGDYIAKVKYTNINKEMDGNLVLVTSTTPNSRGIGKTTLSIGLVDGLNKIGQSAIGSLREPSLGPVFGIKGGAAGGGYSQVYPMEEINLHFTGDMHAITTVTNLINAVIENSVYQGNDLNIDPNKIIFKRAIDISDRTLRQITVGEGSKFNGIEHQSSFELTVATEIMAVFTLSENLEDFVNKVQKITVAYTYDEKRITVEDLGIAGSIAVLIKDAMNPNLVQTLEGNPILIHGGPFANIAHGTSSQIATKTGMKLANYTICEAGFGADLGAEKFVDLVSRKVGWKPNLVAVATTIPSIKELGGGDDMASLEEGTKNVKRNLQIIQNFNINHILVLRVYETDTPEEIKYVKDWCESQGINFSLNTSFVDGGEGSIELANKVVELSDPNPQIRFNYELEDSFETKLQNLVTNVYGGNSFILSERARKSLELIKKEGLDKLPLCVAKTPFSLSDDPKKTNAPVDFDINVSDVKAFTGAGFIVVYTGNILTLPGLSKTANVYNITYDFDTNETFGLS